jgi:hypothetical protein
MDQNLLIVIAVFVAVAAVAMCIQAGLLFAIFKTARELEKKVVPIIPKVEALIPKVEALLPKVDAMVPEVSALVTSSRLAIDDSRKQIHDITTKTSEILDATKVQLARVDDLLVDATGRARVQMDRAEMVLDDAMNRAQETVAVVHTGIMKPLREIQGVTAGVRAALSFLTRGRHPHMQATADEEMFI